MNFFRMQGYNVSYHLGLDNFFFKKNLIYMKISECPYGYLVSCDDHPDIQPCWFDVEHWRHASRITGSAEGRKTAWFVHHPSYENECVLRHYYRGGLVRYLTADWFLCTGPLETTRPIVELKVLQALRDRGLNVPRPICARITFGWSGMFYQADIIIERVRGAQDLLSHVQNGGPMPKHTWKTLGREIARFHSHGAYHADLNAKNILIVAGDPCVFYLCDWDRGELRDPKEATHWKQENLQRLKRSLLCSSCYTREDWDHLIQGYKHV
jgi:3-deoxy-D-manno-octulosonic acid kinase